MGLPLIDGRSVLRKIREINPDAKIIMTSGFLDAETKSEMHKAGLNHFIQKPYLPQDLLRMIRAVIDTKTA
jgi:DNA-binding response OmpR family regulator